VKRACGSRFIQWISTGVGSTSPHHITRRSSGKSFCRKWTFSRSP
jgi:hypothetical protein